MEGQQVQFSSPYAANNAGIACIFQELSLPDLTVAADNIAITNPPKRLGLIDTAEQYRFAEKLLAQRRRAATFILWRRWANLPLAAPADRRDRQGTGAQTQDL